MYMGEDKKEYHFRLTIRYTFHDYVINVHTAQVRPFFETIKVA